MTKYNVFEKKMRITGTLVFDTAFHIGSGREGELATNMGVLLDSDGTPVLPGSTLKGCFRAFAERLAVHLGMTACMLDNALSGIPCVGDESYRKKVHDDFKELRTVPQKLGFLDRHVCDVCRLFGSPLQASRIFFSDGKYESHLQRLQIRDGVCIDRDTETARHGAKYDFEVVPRDAEFTIGIDMENPSDKECAIVAAVLAEWEHGFRLGGFTSRGLGRVRLKDKIVQSVDYTDTDQLRNFLLNEKMTDAGELLSEKLKSTLTERVA